MLIISKSLISAISLGILAACGTVPASVSLVLYLGNSPFAIYRVLFVAALLLTIPSILLYSYSGWRRPWFNSFVVTFLIIITLGAYPFYRFTSDELTQDSDYIASVIKVARAHDYPLPRERKDLLSWYWSSMPHPIGAGAHFYVVPGPGENCELVWNRGLWPLTGNVYPVASSVASKNLTSWLRGTLVHELAHCFDSEKDIAENFEGWTSLPPYLRSSPKSFVSSKISSGALDLELWREVVADLQQIGFWRLSEGSERARVLAEQLKQGRQDMAGPPNFDVGHNTSCWLGAASAEPGPIDYGNVYPWANSLRMKIFVDRNLNCKDEVHKLRNRHR